MGIHSTDSYFHVDATHGSFNSMRSDAETKHQANSPGTLLSVVMNISGTEAIVKVRGGKDWSPGWLNAPFVKRVFTSLDHNDIFLFFYGPEWQSEIKQ